MSKDKPKTAEVKDAFPGTLTMPYYPEAFPRRIPLGQAARQSEAMRYSLENYMGKTLEDLTMLRTKLIMLEYYDYAKIVEGQIMSLEGMKIILQKNPK